MFAVLKRDELRTHSFWWFQTVGWGCFYLLSILVVLPYIRQPGELGYQGIKGLLWDQGLMCFCGFLSSLALRPLCRWLVRRPISWLALEARAAGCSFVVGISVAAVVARLIVARLELIDFLETCFKISVLLFLWCNLYFNIKRSQEQEKERERVLLAEAQAQEAQTRALRYQLNPHFLFNSMNAVSSLVAEGNGSAASKMLAQIAEFLRAVLDGQTVPEVPLSEELALTQQYLAIEQTRLGDRLQVDLTIAPETLDALVPSLLLQPLVENAVRHGIAPLVEGGRIELQSEMRDSRVRISVMNSGRRRNCAATAESPPTLGVGLTNTANRLKTLYGTDHKLELEWAATGGCHVIVELPFRKCGESTGVKTCAC